MPIQDTPAIKLTYTASVSSPLPILMSALGVHPPRDEVGTFDANVARTYTYTQSVAIPSYLIAIAGGEVAFAPLGERTGVWAEPSVLEAATWEFKETERFIKIGEDISGPYTWGNRFDMLVLPASFPYGGESSFCGLIEAHLPFEQVWRTPI